VTLSVSGDCVNAQVAVRVQVDVVDPSPITRMDAHVNMYTVPLTRVGGAGATSQWSGTITIPAATVPDGLSASVLVMDAAGGAVQPVRGQLLYCH
jgi:NADPH-dependent curcumin reductase CurA